jgi:hypothetical protein
MAINCGVISLTTIGFHRKNHQTITFMKNLILAVALLAGLAMAGAPTVLAADETTITGNMVCGKCTLHLTDACQNVVQVTEAGKTVNYFLKQNDVSKSAHGPICGGDSEKVKVTGTLTDEDGKKVLTPTKIEVVKG